ncbi:MAG: M81 family metallopeptidase [Pseudomonadota bacterium]
MKRIALAGFQHETNTFAPGRADLAAFERADSWPGLLTGAAVIDDTRGLNLPIAGAAAAARDAELVPILWCAAEPCGPVTDQAFDEIAGRIEAGLRAAGPLDGLYLDLHGAMVSESHPDGEGALLRRLRAVLGPDLPIAVSLDLHANISETMVREANIVTVFRTYPHLDMAETGARAMVRLLGHIQGQHSWAALRQVPLLIPLHAQSTRTAPAAALYAKALAATQGDEAVEMALGFTAADIPDCGAAVLAYAASPARAAALAEAQAAALQRAAPAFRTALLSPDDALRAARSGPFPALIADVQDNPGAGGTADTTGLLRALLAQTVEDRGVRGGPARAIDAVLGVLCDPQAAAAAHAAGQGSVIETTLGGRSGIPGDAPLHVEARVVALSDGLIPYSGAMYAGGVATLGPACLLSLGVAGTGVVVSSCRIQCLDQALFRHFGVVLEDMRLICVKSTIHFQADFAPLAGQVLYSAAPGAFPCRLRLSDYRKLRAGAAIAGA